MIWRYPHFRKPPFGEWNSWKFTAYRFKHAGGPARHCSRVSNKSEEFITKKYQTSASWQTNYQGDATYKNVGFHESIWKLGYFFATLTLSNQHIGDASNKQVTNSHAGYDSKTVFAPRVSYHEVRCDEETLATQQQNPKAELANHFSETLAPSNRVMVEPTPTLAVGFVQHPDCHQFLSSCEFVAGSTSQFSLATCRSHSIMAIVDSWLVEL